ncbi:hypothetical protein COT72_01730 [archaeon CG10_big_fil_rev_8_21_14_0_10_43_11]|nr:MAG: hypothetical protein COT72_01730 [archaeon CG10_big_fil_rev_8_21_14_0_10_43_11]
MHYELVCQTTPGLEAFAKTDVEQTLSKKATIKNGFVRVKTNDLLDIARLNYASRVVERVDLLLAEYSFSHFDELIARAASADFSPFFKKTKTFAVSCERAGTHEFKSHDVNAEMGGVVMDNLKKTKGWKPKVDLTYPDLNVSAIITNNTCMVGLNTSGESLNKRGYKVYHAPNPLRPSLANALLTYNGWNPDKHLLVDPHCGDGTLIIEAALLAFAMPPGAERKEKFSFLNWDVLSKQEVRQTYQEYDALANTSRNVRVQGMDTFVKNVDGSNKNARLAGVARQVNFSRYNLDWLDDKYGKQEVNTFIVFPPVLHSNKEAVVKFYKELFYQAEYLVKRRMTILTNQHDMVRDLAEEFKFKIQSRHELGYGTPSYAIINLKHA